MRPRVPGLSGGMVASWMASASRLKMRVVVASVIFMGIRDRMLSWFGVGFYLGVGGLFRVCRLESSTEAFRYGIADTKTEGLNVAVWSIRQQAL